MIKKRVKKKDNSEKLNKGLRLAGISGIIVLVLFVLMVFLSAYIIQNKVFNLIYSLIFYVAIIIFTYGFYLLGKKYNNKMLKIVSLILMVFYLLSIIVFQISNYTLEDTLEAVQSKLVELNIDPNTQELTEQQTILFVENILPLILPIIIFFLSYSVMYLVLLILFGVGLIKLDKKKVQYAKVAGLLMVIGAASLLLVVGMFFMAGIIVLGVGYVFSLLILFQESKK